MTNEWQFKTVESLISLITVEANRLKFLQKCASSRDLTEKEIREFRGSKASFNKASEALKIKFN